ncbi:MAG: ATP-binding protein [Muribaculaceae bacterium]|nr:ATP-binding protein [Muribaculaceae bacterium]
MANIYDIRRYGRFTFLISAAAVVASFFYFSNSLVSELAVQERERMQIWADATKEIVSSPDADIDFLLRIIEGNTTIPVLLTDDEGNILRHRNFSLPAPQDTDEDGFYQDPPENTAYLQRKLDKLRNGPNTITIEIAPGLIQHLYYEDSTLLKRMSWYPLIQLVVMLAFVAVVYFAVLSTKKAEQNKVWVGLSKETAHQLGTPISSLMAWMELLPDYGVDAETIEEMNKDVSRLSMIASRFSKIGSEPKMEGGDLTALVDRAASYMATRISPRITLTWPRNSAIKIPVSASAPLLEWVIENLIKNAVDAMNGAGKITVDLSADLGSRRGVIEVSDTGKGIARKNFKNVFNPGFTTKSRGWGLGLTLAKRIIEEYHKGHIFVKDSTPGQGTTFRIELPLAE